MMSGEEEILRGWEVELEEVMQNIKEMQKKVLRKIQALEESGKDKCEGLLLLQGFLDGLTWTYILLDEIKTRHVKLVSKVLKESKQVKEGEKR